MTGLDDLRAQITPTKGTVMVEEHWFDRLHKLLTHDAPRRGVLRTAAAVTLAQCFAASAPAKHSGRGAEDEGNGNRNRNGNRNDNRGRNRGRNRNRNGNRNGNGSGNGAEPSSNPPPSCSGGACAAEPEWAGQPGQTGHCEFICRQCDGDDPREFCVVDGLTPDGSLTKVAVCCDEGQVCCESDCCDHGCCGDDCAPPANDPDVKCCNGELRNVRINAEHCGDCGKACDPGVACQDGTCFNPCAGQPDPWTQYCPDVRFGSPCIPAAALCCGTYWCEPPHEACCNDGRSCSIPGDTCTGAPPSS